MRLRKISGAVVRRLPLYLRVLEDATRDGDKELMSSQELGERAGVSPALVRKDLAWFGEFGKQGVGYDVNNLKAELRRILHLDRDIPIAIVGVGSLGHALARYFRRRYTADPGFHLNIVALFDEDPEKQGEIVEGLPVEAPDKVEERTRELGLKMAIIAVPAEAAQAVVDRVVGAGIKLLLNFAPVKLTVPEGVHMINADLSLELQRLAYYLRD
ncbi:MAG: redox-sensing transcriptional repressor Rex [Firmicutes bacterium ZCTH02-B6]|nr:MAG: redox-sensing transcriptional repressor Rex [Firmicutes bacterium ZCTH02-B6]